MENFTNEQILLRYPPCLRNNIQELWMYGQIGISGMRPQINLPPSKLDFGYNTNMGNTFILNIPYAGKNLQWEVIFNDEDPTFAPDFDILNDTFLSDPAIDTISKHLPSLLNWDVKNSKCLVNVIQEMIALYKREQIERLRNEPKYVDIQEGYDRLKEELKLSDDHIEMFVENNQLNIMISLKLDYSNLPIYIQESYFGGNALLLNPGVDMALLKISFFKNRITSCLQLSPRLEKVFGDYMSLHIPPYTKNDDLVQYIQLIYHLVEEKVNQINENFKLKEEFFSILLSLHGLKVLEYDNIQLNKGLFLFEIESFSFIVLILIGNKFPQEKPTLILKSMYMKNTNGEPHSLKVMDYPYTAQLKPEEMVNRIMKYIEEIAPKLKNYIQIVIDEELHKKIVENAQLVSAMADKDLEITNNLEKISWLEDKINNLNMKIDEDKEQHKKETEQLKKLYFQKYPDSQSLDNKKDCDKCKKKDELEKEVTFWKQESERWSTECEVLRQKPVSNEELTKYYESQLRAILETQQMAVAKSDILSAENDALNTRLDHLMLEKNALDRILDKSNEELHTTHQNYKSQFDAMTEHMAAQNEKITQQCDDIEMLNHKFFNFYINWLNNFLFKIMLRLRLRKSSTHATMFSNLVSFIFILQWTAVHLLQGPNVCTKQEIYTITVTVSEKQPYQVREYVWCLSVPPRCSKYTIKYKIVNKAQTLFKSRPVEQCCDGYAKIDEDRCIPVCREECLHGTCIAPDVCQCTEGFGGPRCHINCPPGLYGVDCQHECMCQNNATCEPNAIRILTGKTAWRLAGVLCNGDCDHVSGECHCHAGWVGPLCDDQCPTGTHGIECQNQCRCQNGGTCDPVTGKCFCEPGWTGSVCANRCPFGYWGEDCKNVCDCYNGAACDHISGECRCLPGFIGDRCLTACSENTWGLNCSESCTCQNGAKCSNVNGKCTCADGWKGDNCTVRICPDKFWGPQCNNGCICSEEHTESCHPWTGKCECKPGWTTEDCSRQCSLLTFGKECRGSCNCKNNAQCSAVDGACLCAPGFKGEDCSETCPLGTFGEDCANKCNCKNGATCSTETGQCHCSPGWVGQNCDRPCSGQFYGANCQQTCNCKNGAACNPQNGTCTCGPGFKGEYCEDKCELGYFGHNCTQVCQCVNGHHLGCDAVSGKCICKPEWKGIECETQCPDGKFGPLCNQECNCVNNSSCDPETGKCICARGWQGDNCTDPCDEGFYGIGCKEICQPNPSGNKTCDHVTGEYTCRPGYIGLTCEHPCPLGTFGKHCKKKCQCKNGADCHHVTGECQCLPGWLGKNCAIPCPSGMYGMNCTQHCKCSNNGKCRGSDGVCKCIPGWTGTQCTEICPEGYHGDHCMNPCECLNDNYMCHPANGCVCRQGFTGERCEDTLAKAKIMPNENNYGTVVAYVLVIVIILLAMLVALWYYYKKRVNNLKNEIAHVQYIADQQTLSSDRNHIDNPMYNYQSNTKRDDDLKLLNNSPQIRNNLVKQINTNMERQRLGIASSSSDTDNRELQALKNKDADATNPNIYHSIDKLDHVYDEIKQKDKEVDLYDHLDYTRPQSTWKPHYQRMPNVYGSRELDNKSEKNSENNDTEDV
ncbi:Brain and reproductive organ-expressed protein (BRE) [Popillia japonica]|uniref:Brain and reproductive organ-expressed protein (BRE) n=1 Tax=Popillia japonica TaxID=7064 RepID=A0AAW1LTN1_POPJA